MTVNGINNRKGFTMIEIIIVIVIIGMILGVALPSMSSAFDVKKKAAAQKLAANIKYLYDRAILEKVYIRLVFDFETNSYYPESTSDPFYLTNEPMEVLDGVIQEPDEEEEKNSLSKGMSTSMAGDLFNDQVLQDDPSRMKWQGWSDFAKKFDKKKAQFSGYQADLSKKTKLPTGIAFFGIQTTSLAEKATKGKAFMHFFPTGRTEMAVLSITDEEAIEEQWFEDDMEIYSVFVSPLSGRAKIIDGLMELPEIEIDDYEEMDG